MNIEDIGKIGYFMKDNNVQRKTITGVEIERYGSHEFNRYTFTESKGITGWVTIVESSDKVFFSKEELITSL